MQIAADATNRNRNNSGASQQDRMMDSDSPSSSGTDTDQSDDNDDDDDIEMVSRSIPECSSKSRPFDLSESADRSPCHKKRKKSLERLAQIRQEQVSFCAELNLLFHNLFIYWFYLLLHSYSVQGILLLESLGHKTRKKGSKMLKSDACLLQCTVM